MKQFTKHIIIWTLMLPMVAWAHDPDQISYHFAQADNTGSLTVHFTAKSALDLLISRHTEFDENAVIRLADYQEDFTQYFNETIGLQLENKEVSLKFNTVDFGGHDASIRFDLVGFEGSFENLQINLSSYTEIYRRTNNHLFIPGHEEVVLNANNQEYSTISTNKSANSMGFLGTPTGLMIALIILALIVGFGAKPFKKKVQVAAE